MATLGERLHRLRERRGWTSQELADRSGVPYMTIYRLEKGLYQDTMTQTSVKLARTLGVPLDVLAGVYTDDLNETHAPRA